MIVIVDYGMGNLRSVEKAFLKVGVDAKVTSSPLDIEDASAVVLPGVGAFRDCMKNLDNLNLLAPVLRSIEKGKPYLGICLGLQILFTESMEFGLCRGLGVIKGKVVRFPQMGLKIPHMGWNTVKLRKTPPIFDGIEDESYFYFVHSYHVAPDKDEFIAGTTMYGIEFTSMIWKDNIIATQFHPEKSQQLGLRVLKGFGEFEKRA
ncbi:MAG: imidazole glycerol phosphate synthase subunit HisH [Nitrospirota bacterium]|nr:imidazole glycerol phosphate synthase subunit HisH [Nitrospirota bacterium]